MSLPGLEAAIREVVSKSCAVPCRPAHKRTSDVCRGFSAVLLLPFKSGAGAMIFRSLKEEGRQEADGIWWGGFRSAM